MADNITVTPGTGKTIAADELAGAILIQRVKAAYGPDGTATDVSLTTPMPSIVTDGTNTATVKAASTAPVAADKAMVVGIHPSSINANGRAAALLSAPVVLSTEDLAAINAIATALAGTLTVGAHNVTNAGTFATQSVVTNAGTFATQAAPNSNAVYAGTTAMTPKWAVISTSSTTTAVVPLVSAKKIRVLAWDLSPSAAVNAKWQSGSTDLTGLYYMGGAGNGQARSFNHVGWFETAAGVVLNLNLSSGVAVGGVVCYVEV